MKTKALSMIGLGLAVACLCLAPQSPAAKGGKPGKPGGEDPPPEPTTPIVYRQVGFAANLAVGTATFNDYGMIVGATDIPFPPKGYRVTPTGQRETLVYRDEDIEFFCDTHIRNVFHVNNLDQITGSYHAEAEDGSYYERAELWLSDGNQINLKVASEKVYCPSIDINDSGMVLVSGYTIAGIVLPVDGDWDGLADTWVVENDGINELFYPIPVGFTPLRINEYGQILYAEGVLLTPDYNVLEQGGNPWKVGNARLQNMEPLPGEIAEETTAGDFNDYGEVVGQSGDRAVLWTTPENPAEIKTPKAKHARAHGINNQRQIIGSYNPTKYSTTYFLVYEGDLYKFSDLMVDEFSGNLSQINNDGWILGGGAVYIPMEN